MKFYFGKLSLFVRIHLFQLGISEIFEQGKANLSGLLETEEQLSVSEAIHKAFIEINEEGTEAAAATGNDNLIQNFAKYQFIDFDLIRSPGISIVPLSLLIIPPDTPIFRADHPFVYYIWDNKTKTVIFSGRITKLN